MLLIAWMTVGSPPQVRGKLVYNAHNCPALADHPRRCGENFRNLLCNTWDLGSPPQVRGKQKCPAVVKPENGITPAGAGKTSSHSALPLAPWDHPRRCGENASTSAAALSRTGSPPQVRGKPLQPPSLHRSLGITPAGAGKTALSRMFRRPL